MGKRVLVAISGGMDSAVAAALLKTQGYEVAGVHFTMWQKEDTNDIEIEGGSCVYYTQAKAAEKLCKSLEIPYYAVDLRDQYEADITDYVLAEYLQTRMPNPCILCNYKVKFGALLKKADELRYDFVATGHYAKVVRNAEGSETNLYRASDKSADQSYYLFGLTQDQMQRALMPLGDLLRANVVKMAHTFQLEVDTSDRPHKTCFIGSGGYLDLIEKRVPERYRVGGPIVTQDGQVLSRHTGLYQFSIGQTHGLGLTHPDHSGYCVLGFDQKLSAVIVGPESDLKRPGLLATNCNWLGIQDFSRGLRAMGKIGSDHAEAPCVVTLLNNNCVQVDFTEPQRAITPGQAIVFYHEDLVVGGGWIEALTVPVTTKLRSRGLVMTY